jgi:UDP-N-acetylglucosamine--N-acetylmuramyl-(pentapeptide) pyrophosphoryl-undecaprenol N-acetylglucosamine transferase
MNTNKIKRLAIICGGTGGHFYPGLTVARVFQKNNDCKACLFIGGHKVGNQVFDAKKYGIDVKEVKSARISKHPIKFIVFMLKFMQGYLRGKKLLKEFKPDAALAMGSFTSVPISLSAVKMRIPLFLHDGNAKIGRANIFLSRWAKLVMTAFPPVNYNLLKCRHICTGMPLRPEILNAKLNKQEALKRFNEKYSCSFTSEAFTILVFGGSQGAATINRVIPKTIPLLDVENLQVIHLIGKRNSKTAESLYQSSSINHLVLECCDKMTLLYSAADLVICRSGGSTIAELMFFEKPAILIPYPLAADLHQNDNANFYAKSGLAEIVFNKDCTETKMRQIIDKFIARSKHKPTDSLITSKKTNAADKIIKFISKEVVI